MINGTINWQQCFNCLQPYHERSTKFIGSYTKNASQGIVDSNLHICQPINQASKFSLGVAH